MRNEERGRQSAWPAALRRTHRAAVHGDDRWAEDGERREVFVALAQEAASHVVNRRGQVKP